MEVVADSAAQADDAVLKTYSRERGGLPKEVELDNILLRLERSRRGLSFKISITWTVVSTRLL